VVFGRPTYTTAKFHAYLKAPLTEFSNLGLSAVKDKPGTTALYFQRSAGTYVAISLADDERARLLELQVREIWDQATLAFRNWQQHLGPKGLMELSPSAFERLVTSQFESVGAKARHTGKTGDGGVDAEFTYLERLYIVQCKRFTSPVGPGPVRELLGTALLRGAVMGFLVSTSGFTQAARTSAKGQPVRLLGPNDLAALDRSMFDPERPAEPSRLAASEGGTSLPRVVWPTPQNALRLKNSPSTPQFAQLPLATRNQAMLRGLRHGLETWVFGLVVLALVLWFTTHRLDLVLAPLPILLALTTVWGTRSYRHEEARRGPTCLSCRHAAQNHRLATFSPNRMRLSCVASCKCDHLLPDPAKSSGPQPDLKALLYLAVPKDQPAVPGRVVAIERSVEQGEQGWRQIIELPLAWGHALFTDSGASKFARYRYRFRQRQEPGTVGRSA